MKKAKVYDCFLFFQEVELLRLRLSYLYNKVDYFIIVESGQTFSGRKKNFDFESIKESLSNFQDKIIYFKNEYIVESYDSLSRNLEKKGDPVSLNILDNMNNHTHYKKKELNWVIDTFQRESIKYPLSNSNLNDDDIVLFSDLDEIPSHHFIEACYQINNNFISNRQFEFSFKLNILSNENWYGTIATKWKTLKFLSLNSLRLDVRQKFKIVQDLKIHHGGYHFTSYGQIDKIKKKIVSMGHQEFNNFIIKLFLNKNIEFGMDIFGRTLKSQYKVIDIKNNFYFDEEMQKQIKKYDLMVARNFFKKTPVYYYLFFILAKIARAIYYFKN